MSKLIYQDIAVSDLEFDLVNAREPEQGSQHEALLALITDKEAHLDNLAEDIGKVGLSPAEEFIVIPSATSKGKFISAEGNRRVAALKLLHTPSLAIGTDLEKRFARLHASYAATVPKRVRCVIMSREDADIWVQRKHDRGLEGAGLVQWNSPARSRFRKRTQGRETLEHKLIELVRQDAGLTATQRTILAANVAGTTLRRVLKDREFKDTLGYKIENEDIIAHDPAAVGSAIKKMVLDIASGDIKVKHVYDAEDRKKYLRQFKAFRPSPAALKQGAASVAASLAATASGTKPAGGATWSTARRQKPRQVLVDSDFRPAISRPKTAELLKQLRSLVVDDYTILVAMGFRTFIELSCLEYQVRKQLTMPANQELHQRIEACESHLQSIGVPANELKAARVLAKGPKDNVLSTHTFNAYVHNPDFFPTTSDLLRKWDLLRPFLLALWTK